ncbi:hypothetical protein LLEC1_06805 [Akanthomyces lecanii]|uniref:Zn(2)-C6 fungal-type domain-containing protein n=1 Tax=Cordyceps confragosa TaxID=2714763 RepID=A0A179IJ84_CORDF|nr:hypothetical protein LLEC1_06805 [Akanthomyces lecanii]
MPGVPSGRACDNCRRRRQKCDYATPTCSRCIRLGVECVGSGERRFLFIDQKCARRQNRGHDSDGSAVSTPSSSLQSISPCLMNEADALVNSFAAMIKPSTDRRVNLAWTYGEFLQKVPPRLGSNKALDVAAEALVVSHRDFSLRRPVTPDNLAKYSDAIKALSQGINDHITSHSLETICAVILLTMCQNLSGLGLEHLNSHCQGAVQMLRARQTYHNTDEFELDLHTYMHGPVVSFNPWYPAKQTLTATQLVQSVFNRAMRLSPSKFKALSRVLVINRDSPGSSILALLFQIPALLQRGRTVRQGYADREAFVSELSSIYKTLQTAKSFLYSKYMMGPSTESKHTSPFGFCLAFSCIFNCMLRGIDPRNPQLLLEAEDLVKETLNLVPEAQLNRPLGAAHMMLNLSFAWVCAKDEHERQSLHTLLGDFNWDFGRDADAMWPIEDHEALLCDLQFRTDPKVVLVHAA